MLSLDILINGINLIHVVRWFSLKKKISLIKPSSFLPGEQVIWLCTELKEIADLFKSWHNFRAGTDMQDLDLIKHHSFTESIETSFLLTGNNSYTLHNQSYSTVLLHKQDNRNKQVLKKLFQFYISNHNFLFNVAHSILVKYALFVDKNLQLLLYKVT